jgi:hypothetical protein
MELCKTERGYELRARQRIDQPIDPVFAFFCDARNLQKITPPWLDFRILGEGAIQMRQGALIDYQLKLRGLRLRWQSEITVWQPPHRFVDEQRRGPYRSWRHEHRFESAGRATIIHDHVIYQPPGGPLAGLINHLFVSGDVRRIFRYRQDTIEQLLAEPTDRPTIHSGGDRVVRAALGLIRHGSSAARSGET